MKKFEKIQTLLATLSDSNRLGIIHFIGDGRSSVSEIVQATGLSQPLVSHHLRTLKESGILETTRKGPFIYYSLKMSALLDVLGILWDIADEINVTSKSRPMFKCPPWWRKMHMQNK
jgi:DNA-binding transcriptional ArsR family regulator